MIISILAIGDDYGCVGSSNSEIYDEFCERVRFIMDLGMDATGTLVQGGSVLSCDYSVCFAVFKPDGSDITLDEWRGFSDMYRAAFPTFDGHIVLSDISRDKNYLAIVNNNPI